MDERRLAALAERLGEWPLLLRLVNSQLRKLVRDRGPEASEALRRVEERLAKAGLRAFDQRDATERSEAASLTIELSLGALSAHDRRRFLDLAVFPEDVDVPLHVLERLWELADWEAEELCGHLEDSSLLLDFTQETIRLHDVVRQYLVDEHSDLPQAHRRLLELCRPPSGRWTDLETGETFLWRHLATHLDGAGDRDEIRRLLFDLDYLESGETIRTLEGHTAGVNAVAVVDATRLVSASEDQTLRVWDLASGETAAVFALDAPVGSVAVIAGGRGIVAGDGVGGVHFLDLDQS